MANCSAIYTAHCTLMYLDSSYMTLNIVLAANMVEKRPKQISVKNYLSDQPVEVIDV